jgi:hypothetical protein
VRERAGGLCGSRALHRSSGTGRPGPCARAAPVSWHIGGVPDEQRQCYTNIRVCGMGPYAQRRQQQQQCSDDDELMGMGALKPGPAPARPTTMCAPACVAPRLLSPCLADRFPFHGDMRTLVLRPNLLALAGRTEVGRVAEGEIVGWRKLGTRRDMGVAIALLAVQASLHAFCEGG